MALSLTDVQDALAETVRELASRKAPLSTTRTQTAALTAGETGALWAEIAGQGLPAIHLPEEVGGMGGTLQDLAVAAEVAGEVLLPGPFLPTVFASALAQQAGAGDEVLARFAEGATAAVLDGAFAASGGALTGVSSPALGALAAQLYVVLVPEGEGFQLHLVDAASGTTQASEGIDLTRDLGVVTLQDAPAQALGSVSRATVLALVGTLYGAEAAGLMRSALAGAVEYSTQRSQFGTQIGAFQSTKHKAARMAITAELAASAAWGAALSLEQDDEQRRLAGSAAILTALVPAGALITDAVTIYGGIGFTWEHDIHFSLRRAISIGGLGGSLGNVEAGLGQVALGTDRTAEVELAEEDPAFRARIGALLDEALALPEDTPRFEGLGGQLYARGPRRAFLADHGLTNPHWPAPWGLGASPTEQVVIAQEFAARNLAQYTTVIGEWAMPTVLAHGTEAQKELLARPTMLADIIWCQLFSEPDAGSDLASLRTKATKVDGGWRLDGQKVWTSGAHQAQWGICLARTDQEAPKHKGISFFLVDMASEGITVRPLTQSTGENEFNEVFLDGVFVPEDMMVGEPGQGWRVTMTTLANERTSIGSGLTVGAEEGLRQAVKAGAYDDEREALRALGRVAAQSTAIGSLNLAETLRRLNGLQPGPGSSLAKVATAELSRVAAAAARGVAGPRSVLAHDAGDPALAELALPQGLIGGGTVEIQLNVIAERVLAMPRG
ncbi:MAG: acyl-CoA dehydrogenase [Arthrobacter sp.]|jgi:alkylation response protein AidB-like acyl-CoA dehydrogenase|nr:acyl-CoA dehydrogenase [Arthrobacter sp.]